MLLLYKVKDVESTLVTLFKSNNDEDIRSRYHKNKLEVTLLVPLSLLY